MFDDNDDVDKLPMSLLMVKVIVLILKMFTLSICKLYHVG